MRAITICALLCLLLACRRDSKPKGLLEPKAMQSVLFDMMRADQFLSDFVLNKDSSKKRETESARLYEQVFALHKITGDQFRESLAYYRAHPEMLRAVMDSLSQPLRADTLPALAQPATTPVPVPADVPTPGRQLPDTMRPAQDAKKIAD